MSPKTSGARANFSGVQLERFVCQALLGCGYTRFEGSRRARRSLFADRHTLCGPQFAVEPVIGQSVYGTSRKADILVIDNRLFPSGLVIECKWQRRKGSVDEKLVYLNACINLSALPTVVLLDGGGAKPGAIAWLKSQITPQGPLLAVYTMSEFQAAINDGFLTSPLPTL